MPTRNLLRMQRAVFVGLTVASLLLAACTRSATTNTLPTATTEGDTLVEDKGQEATMAAIGTEVSGQLTATAQAISGNGGEPTATLPPDVLPTETPLPGGGEGSPTETQPPPPQPTNTPPPPPPATAVPPAQVTPCSNPYTVKDGDWIYQIARNCGVSARDLIAANPGINPNYIVPGQLLNMPGQTTPGQAPATGCTGDYTVVSGDNLYRIAFRCGLTVEQIAAANGIT